MASLATARTRLGLGGVSQQSPGSFLARVAPTDFAVSDTWSVSLTETPAPPIIANDSRTGYTQNFSRMGLDASSRRNLGAFSAKSEVSTADLSVTDTWLVTLSESPVDSNEIIAVDDWRTSLTEAINLRNNQAVTDTWSVSVVETIGLLQSGVNLVASTDTWSVTLTEGTGVVDVAVAVTDTLTVDFDDSATPTVDTPLALVTVTDDWNVTATEEVGLSIFAGVVPLSVVDTWNVAISDNGLVSVSQPVGRITFRVLQPSIKFEFV